MQSLRQWWQRVRSKATPAPAAKPNEVTPKGVDEGDPPTTYDESYTKQAEQVDPP